MAQQSELGTILSASPKATGFSATEWTTGPVTEYIEREYDVEFTLRHTVD